MGEFQNVQVVIQQRKSPHNRTYHGQLSVSALLRVKKLYVDPQKNGMLRLIIGSSLAKCLIMICPDWCSLQWSESALFLLVVIQSFSSFSAGSYCYCCMLWRIRDCIDLICTVLWCKMCWTVHLPICCGEGSVTGQSVAWLKLWETYSRVCSPALKKSLKMVPMVPMSWRDKNTPKKAETWLYLSLPYVFHPKHLR